MFKQASFADEIYRSMESSLVKSQTEEKHGFSKLDKAIDLLNTAASIFESAHMYSEADEVTAVLKSLTTLEEEEINEKI